MRSPGDRRRLTRRHQCNEDFGGRLQPAMGPSGAPLAPWSTETQPVGRGGGIERRVPWASGGLGGVPFRDGAPAGRDQASLEPAWPSIPCCRGRRKTWHTQCNQSHGPGPIHGSAFLLIEHTFDRGQRTIVPKVIRPTRAFSGSRLRLMTSDSLRAAKLSSSWQVSTTYRKIGGLGAGRDRRYSIVVLEG